VRDRRAGVPSQRGLCRWPACRRSRRHLDRQVRHAGRRQEYTFTFTGSGGQLAGTAKSTLLGDTKLSEIKVDGDKVSFVENGSFQDMPLRITYTGTFSGADEIKFTRVVVEGTPEEAVAKRSK
jgi:hypothetical protein